MYAEKKHQNTLNPFSKDIFVLFEGDDFQETIERF